MSDGQFPPEVRLEASPDVIVQRTGEEMIVVHLGTSCVYDLNRTSTRLWEMLTEGRPRHEAEAELLREFAVDAGALAREVDATLAHLTEQDLLRVRSGD
jgi:hypothetical protein